MIDFISCLLGSPPGNYLLHRTGSSIKKHIALMRYDEIEILALVISLQPRLGSGRL